VAAVKKLDTEDHACFIKAMGGTQHIGPGSVADFQQIIDMKRELVSALILPQRRLLAPRVSGGATLKIPDA
jgi:hypothetical protein